MAKITNLFDNQAFFSKKIACEQKKEAAQKEAAPNGLLTLAEDYGAKVGNNQIHATITEVMRAEKEAQMSVSPLDFADTTTKEKQRKKPYIKPQAVKELERLADIENQRRHPNTPVKYLAKCKYRDDTYSGLVKCIADYIRLQGGTAQRLASSAPQDTRRTVKDVIGRKYEIGSVDYAPSGSDPSGSDINAVIHGLNVLIAARPGGHSYQDGGVYFFGDFSQFFRWYQQAFRA